MKGKQEILSFGFHANWESHLKFMKAKSWITRFIKFNAVGFVVFLVGTIIYAVFFNLFGFWAWLIANGLGSVLHFSLISYFNKKRLGKMFDSYEYRAVNMSENQVKKCKRSFCSSNWLGSLARCGRCFQYSEIF